MNGWFRLKLEVWRGGRFHRKSIQGCSHVHNPMLSNLQMNLACASLFYVQTLAHYVRFGGRDPGLGQICNMPAPAKSTTDVVHSCWANAAPAELLYHLLHFSLTKQARTFVSVVQTSYLNTCLLPEPCIFFWLPTVHLARVLAPVSGIPLLHGVTSLTRQTALPRYSS